MLLAVSCCGLDKFLKGGIFFGRDFTGLIMLFGISNLSRRYFF